MSYCRWSKTCDVYGYAADDGSTFWATGRGKDLGGYDTIIEYAEDGKEDDAACLTYLREMRALGLSIPDEVFTLFE